MSLETEALAYHSSPQPGKIEVVPTKPCRTQHDLSLAYTPGVAVPCLRIQEDPSESYRYTSRGNLVAVISNGTAVLGLGDIGALAGKPVMEGKGVLFKRFAGIDVFDIEVDTTDPDEFISVVSKLEPTFGGINLEDIKAPECFYIERKLIEMMDIPVFHDDQHGTAIISGAALINACEVQGKRISDVRVVFSGAGAAGIACAKFYIQLGVRPENLLLLDSIGVIYKGREKGMNPYKAEFAVDTPARTLADALKGADVFAGLSKPGLVTQAMVKTMAAKPIIFAMANPTPEIFPEEVRAVRADAIVATGRSDFPNQVNNVLGFPFIFRGALDVRARKINEEMKIAACQALAKLTREDVPDEVLRAYGVSRLHFGPDYIIPKPFDPRVLTAEASAVAQAAIDSGVARLKIESREIYQERLEASRSRSQEFMQIALHRAKCSHCRIVFPEGKDPRVIRGARRLLDEELAMPVLVGPPEKIRSVAAELDISLEGVEFVDPYEHPERKRLREHLFIKRQRKGMTMVDAAYWCSRPNWFAALMLDLGMVDGMVTGLTRNYPATAQGLLAVLPRREGVRRVCGMNVVLTKHDVLFFADATMQREPGAEELADIAMLAAAAARYFSITPRVAMLSFSNFGSVRDESTNKVREAVEIVRRHEPELVIDGEMQADTALSGDLQKQWFPFCRLGGPANVLVFPNLDSANIASKILSRLGSVETIGPLMLGMGKPVNVLHPGCDVRDVINAAAITVLECLNGTL